MALILPKYVAFKGDNGQYLRLRHLDPHYPYLQASSDDIGDSTVACEICPTSDGNFRIKQICNNKFWRRSPNWIWADANNTSWNNKDTLFRLVKYDDKTIGLINLGNNNFCKRLTTEGKTNCLNAGATSLIRSAKLTVEEPVLSREIYGVSYDLDNAKIYGERVRTVGEGSEENIGRGDSELTVEVKCQDEETTTWKSMVSFKSSVRATAQAGIPKIAESKVVMTAEIQAGIEWNKTNQKITTFTVRKKTLVPPKTRVTVKAIATQLTCDVPFTFMQNDTLYDGKTFTTKCHGTFTGANYHKTQFKTTFEPLQ